MATSDLRKQMDSLQEARNGTAAALADLERVAALPDLRDSKAALQRLTEAAQKAEGLRRLLTAQDAELDRLRRAIGEAERRERAAANEKERRLAQEEGERLLTKAAGAAQQLLTDLGVLNDIVARVHRAQGTWSPHVHIDLAPALRRALAHWAQVRPDILGLPPLPSMKERRRAELQVMIDDTERGIRELENEPPRLGEDAAFRQSQIRRARADLARLKRDLDSFS